MRHYNVFSNLDKNQIYFSTSALQPCEHGWVVISGSLPMTIAPREKYPTGVIRTLEEYISVFHQDKQLIDNPDPLFQPAGLLTCYRGATFITGFTEKH